MPEIADLPETTTRKPLARHQSAAKAAKKDKTNLDLWRTPIDLSPELATRLLHGLAEIHRRRLEVFARRGERVSARDLLAATGDADLRVLSYFQGALSRKLRRLLADEEKKVHLIGWDFGATEWDDEHAKIVDGVCYVTKATRDSLMQCLGYAPEKSPSESR
jgi:hypothetical protein